MTLEVSKLSGWLNADASYEPRVEKRAYDSGRAAGREAGGPWEVAAQAASTRGGLDCRFGAGHGEERTENMRPMFVTLEVSKLSGWLNADADCRVESRAYDAERGVGREAGGRWLAAAQERYTRGERAQL